MPDGEAEFRAIVEQVLARARRRPAPRVRDDPLDGTADRVVGSTSFLDPQRWPGGGGRLDSIEIGATWLAASAQRTAVNTEAKLLMLAHAFDALGVHRVVLNTDARNDRSRAAIARIGATFEGVLHSFRYGVEGTPRDTATFAIPARDWPEVARRACVAAARALSQASGLIAAASQRPSGPGTTSNSTPRPDRDRAGAVGDRVQWNG